MPNTMITKSLNRKERRTQQLMAHYTSCEALALACGKPASQVDGKEISVALLRLESIAYQGAVLRYASDPAPTRVYWPKIGNFMLGVEEYDFNRNEDHIELFKSRCADLVRAILGGVPPGFFVSFDPRGYALKIDPDNADGKKLIEECKMQTDSGQNGILSPEITGN